MKNEETKKEKTKKNGTAVWLGLLLMLLSASTSGCYAWVRWGIV